MKKVLQIAGGIILACFVLMVGCSALVASSADDVKKEIDKTSDRYEQQQREYYACAETLDISDPHYLTKLNACSEGLYK